MKRHISRRQMLALAALSAGSACGLCGVGGLASVLIARRAQQPTPTPLPTPLPPPRPTETPSVAILPRAAWGARPPDHSAANEQGFASGDNPYGWYVYQGDLTAIYRTVAIHHSYPIRRDTGTMRDIQNLHMDQQKWADIAYHFGIDGRGVVYAGRDLNVRGASVAGYNTGTVGVVVIGDFQEETPAPAQLDSLQKLVRWLAQTLHLTHLAGHYEFNPETVCPGAAMQPNLDRLAQQANLKRGTGGYVPPTAAPAQPTPKSGCC
jgi:hypothetical protein